MTAARPIVLVMAAQDPTGGAGLQADLETIAALGGHAACLPTALTVQDTSRVLELLPLPAAWLRRQARVLLADLPVQACKIGVVGKPAMAREIRRVLACLPGVPVVLDPVLRAGGGGLAAGPAMRTALLELLPRVTLLTPNRAEALSLGNAQDPDRAAAALLERGTRNVLITSAAAGTRSLLHSLYDEAGRRHDFRRARRAGAYHGSGCTLAAALALELARGLSPRAAVPRALDYTAGALARAFAPGRGQRLPGRVPQPDLR